MGSEPTPQRTAAQEALIRARLTDEAEPFPPPVEHVTDAELRRALDWLLAIRHERRPHQRKRRAITYQQRDQVAAILLRLARTTPRTAAMTAQHREKWIRDTIAEMNRLAAGTGSEGKDFALTVQQEADIQEDDYGDDAATWEKPQDVAVRFAADFDAPASEGDDTNPEDESK